MKLTALLENKLDEAKTSVLEQLDLIRDRKLVEMKKMVGAKLDFVSEAVDDLIEARIRIVKARIRNGKIQRRKKVSNVSGYTFRGGRLKRLSVTERRNRRMGQRRGKIKRRAKLSRSLIKRKRSLRKRASIGLP